MGYLMRKALAKLFLVNYREFHHCIYASLISMFGSALFIASLIPIVDYLFSGKRRFFENEFLNVLILLSIAVLFFFVARAINRLAERFAHGYIQRRVKKDWEYAIQYVIDNPDKLEYCMELSPEFANKWHDKCEREKRLDMELEQMAQEAEQAREARRRARDSFQG